MPSRKPVSIRDFSGTKRCWSRSSSFLGPSPPGPPGPRPPLPPPPPVRELPLRPTLERFFSSSASIGSIVPTSISTLVGDHQDKEDGKVNDRREQERAGHGIRFG